MANTTLVSAKPTLTDDELAPIQIKLFWDRPLDTYDMDRLKRLSSKFWEQTDRFFCFHPRCSWQRAGVFTGEDSEEVKKGLKALTSHISTKHWYWKLAHMDDDWLDGRRPPAKPKARAEPKVKAPRRNRSAPPQRFEPYPRSVPAAAIPSSSSSAPQPGSGADRPSLPSSSRSPPVIIDLTGETDPPRVPSPTIEPAPFTYDGIDGMTCILCGYCPLMFNGYRAADPQEAMDEHLQIAHYIGGAPEPAVERDWETELRALL